MIAVRVFPSAVLARVSEATVRRILRARGYPPSFAQPGCFLAEMANGTCG
jgi:hypothetical protein